MYEAIYIFMLANYSEEKGFSFKQTNKIDISDDIKNFLTNNVDEKILKSKDAIEEIGKAYNITDKQCLKFTDNLRNGSIQLKDDRPIYKHMKNICSLPHSVLRV